MLEGVAAGIIPNSLDGAVECREETTPYAKVSSQYRCAGFNGSYCLIGMSGSWLGGQKGAGITADAPFAIGTISKL